jgi:predicted MPP superfamily phosphohydrolase
MRKLSAARSEALHHALLHAPEPARQAPRRFFDPAAGWFRGVERRTSIFLSRHVFPRVPALHVPYGQILDRHLTVSDAEIALAGLPPALDGLVVLLVTDVHAGPFLSREVLARAFAKLATLGADVVVHGGDLATTTLREAEAHEGSLRALKGKLGTFAVLGNHDHYTGSPDGIVALFERCGVRVLDNDAAPVRRSGATLAIAGVDDWNFGSPDLPKALSAARELDRSGPLVLVSHNPDAFFAATRSGVSLVLSGHTHGGQVRIPGLPVLVRMSRYRLDEGRYSAGSGEIVVSRGLGVSGIPLRIACAPEAVRLTLRRASDS